MPYGFERQLPIVPPNLNDLKLPPNPFNILATMALVNFTGDGHDDNYSPQSLEPSDPSPISTPRMNMSTIDGWETPHTTTDDNIFYSEDEPKRVHLTSPLDETFHSEGEPRQIYLLCSPSPPSPPAKMKRKLEMRMSFPKRRGASQHVSAACGQLFPQAKDIPGPSTKYWRFYRHLTIITKANKVVTHIAHHISSIVYSLYVVVTYPTCAHICISC